MQEIPTQPRSPVRGRSLHLVPHVRHVCVCECVCVCAEGGLPQAISRRIPASLYLWCIGVVVAEKRLMQIQFTALAHQAEAGTKQPQAMRDQNTLFVL